MNPYRKRFWTRYIISAVVVLVVLGVLWLFGWRV